MSKYDKDYDTSLNVLAVPNSPVFYNGASNKTCYGQVFLVWPWWILIRGDTAQLSDGTVDVVKKISTDWRNGCFIWNHPWRQSSPPLEDNDTVVIGCSQLPEGNLINTVRYSSTKLWKNCISQLRLMLTIEQTLEPFRSGVNPKRQMGKGKLIGWLIWLMS